VPAVDRRKRREMTIFAGAATVGIRRPVAPSIALPRSVRTVARWLAWAPPFGRDLAVVLGVIGLYFVARGQAPARIDESVQLTLWLVEIERALGLFVEPQVQAASIQWHWSREVANFTYAYLHFPVLAAVGIWLWFRDRASFRFLRNVMFVSMVIGLVFYYALPAAPPRLMALHGHEMGFTDTVFAAETSVSYAQPSLILNEYAAIPSFHFGWIALAAAAIWTQTRRAEARVAAVLLTALMTWAIVASANHLFIDMALGGAVIVVSWRAARRLARVREADIGSTMVATVAA
jgi:hypothetical protein